MLLLLLLLNRNPKKGPGRGRISKGPTDALVERTLEFVFAELARWRDDPDRLPEEVEERLNAQLCKYLNVAARNCFPMVHFSHEEKQTGTRRVDMSALPISRGIIGHTYYTIYDPFLVLEGKRLPAPPPSSREREYVTGGKEKSGGIQRFKLSLHGAQQNTAAIVGYIQKGELKSWHLLINRWIQDLASDTTAVEEKWLVDEQLAEFVADHTLQIASAWSLHKRSGAAISAPIRIRHLWVVMQN
jgi:hypothetical protein